MLCVTREGPASAVAGPIMLQLGYGVNTTTVVIQR